MKLFFFIISLLSFLFSMVSYASQNVPFNNVKLNPNQPLTANYSFDNHQIIFCYTPSLATLGEITWPYKGSIQSGSLPMALVKNTGYTGELADTNGSITIKNTTGNTISVSCNFAF